MTTVSCSNGLREQDLKVSFWGMASCISVSPGSAACRASGETGCVVQPIPSCDSGPWTVEANTLVH